MRDFVILGFVALVGIGVFNGLATWLEKILNEVHNMPMTDAGNISAALILSGMIGCFVIPLISDKIGRRKPFLILASLVGALAVTAFIFAKSYGLNMLNGVLIGFFLISALPIMLTMSAEITGLRYAGVSVGYLQLLGNAAAVVLVAAMESLRGSTGGFVIPLTVLAVLLVGSFKIEFILKGSDDQVGEQRFNQLAIHGCHNAGNKRGGENQIDEAESHDHDDQGQCPSVAFIHGFERQKQSEFEVTQECLHNLLSLSLNIAK
jgi:MFS family permease